MRTIVFFSLQMLSSRLFKSLVIIIISFLSFYLLAINISIVIDTYSTNNILKKQNLENAYFFSYSNTVDVNSLFELTMNDNIISDMPNVYSVSKILRSDGYSEGFQELISVIMYDTITIKQLNWELIDGEWFSGENTDYIPGIIERTYCPSIEIGDIIEVELFDVLNHKKRISKSIKIVGIIDKEYFSIRGCTGLYTASEDLIEKATQPTLLIPIIMNNDGSYLGESYPNRIIWLENNDSNDDIYNNLTTNLKDIGSFTNLYSMKKNQNHRNNEFLLWEGLICFILLIITIISIIGYNYLLIEEKKKDVAIFLLCGMERKRIRKIFIVHNLILITIPLIMLLSALYLNLKSELLNVFYFEINNKIEVYLITAAIYLIIHYFVINYVNNILRNKSTIKLLMESEIC